MCGHDVGMVYLSVARREQVPSSGRFALFNPWPKARPWAGSALVFVGVQSLGSLVFDHGLNEASRVRSTFVSIDVNCLFAVI